MPHSHSLYGRVSQNTHYCVHNVVDGGLRPSATDITQNDINVNLPGVLYSSLTTPQIPSTSAHPKSIFFGIVSRCSADSVLPRTTGQRLRNRRLFRHGRE